ncbi:MAG TPA: VWA domain-containing protein [Candidatus Mediterraneibacter stercorigallinarum]|uniref:VWA domain-containing protein n=1 Tax=Candidatus Mediterraneibacter stercorigallinarum TaxID=2838686 RepID=A0A9D2DAB9_9FIRM|nr:VWA domain-containing protein [Candidatus Mediterraneibacter stercorigallinarum]
MKSAKKLLALVLALMMIIGAVPMQPLNAQAAGMNQNTEISADDDSYTPDEAAADSSGSEEEPSQSEPTEEAAMPDEITEEANGPEETAEVQNGAEIPAEDNGAELPSAGSNALQAEPRAVTPATYEQVDRVTAGEEYLIVYRVIGYYGGSSYYALTANGTSVTATQVYPSGREIDLTAEENNVLWTVNNNSIQINGQTLKATEYYGNYSVSLSSNYGGTNFVVNDDNMIRAYVGGRNRYLSYSNYGWSVSRSFNSNFTFYQKHDGSDVPPVNPGKADDPLYSDEAEGGDYPQYPNQGSVRTTKTATADNFRENGVAQVELGVTGVPMKQGVDIVLVLDVSTSMDDDNKLTDAKAAAKNFVENYVFAPNADGTQSNNRLGLVTFSGFREGSGWFDSGEYDGTGNDIQYELKNANAKQNILDTIDRLETNSGTDYDFAFSGADDVLDHALDTREKYVVFMTDGAPSKYNGYTVPGSNSSTFRQQVNNYDLSTAEAVKNQGVTVYTIGFAMDEGNEPYEGVEFSAQECQNILKKIATDDNHYINASNGQDLQEAFESIGSSLRKAGTEAVVTDEIGSAYTLQKTTSQGFDTTPVIEVKSYELDENGSRTGEPTVIETVTFENDGATATSSVKGQLTVDNNGSFAAQYFSYDVSGWGDNKTETFTWNIGDINDTEIVLSYYVYLKGSMTGERGDGIYPTNERAVLDYVNYLGHDAQRTFERPVLPWGAATVTYEFYLVNEQGQPVNSAGTVIPFEERVKVVSPQTERFNWNSQTEIDASLKAEDYVPDGYTLHIPDATFTAHAVSSGNGSMSAAGTVPEGSADSTKYGNNDPQCTSTWVAFGVLNRTTLIPDSIVLDYGKKVKIDVMENDLLQNAVLNSVAKEDALGYDFNFEDDKTPELAAGFGASVEATNGTATVEDGVVVYEPTKYMDSIDRFLYSASITMGTEDGQTETQYKYQTVSVIPATTVYYEDNFGSTEDADGTNGIIYSGDWEEVQEGTAGSKYQDNGSVAEDRHPYGNDSSYAENDKLSAGSAMMVTADGDTNATASFTFKGTGFDLISRTDNASAMIAVAVQDESGAYVQRKMLDLKYQSGTLYQIPVYQARFDKYGTYTVTITVSNAGDSTNFYLDGIRIYNPIDPNGADAEEAQDQYRTDREANAEITELRNILLDAESYKEGTADGILYTDGNDNGSSVYESQGPNNEVYLKPGHSVGFKLHVGAGMRTVQLGAKAVNGDVSLMVGSNETTQQSRTLTSASDMYYDITQTLSLTTSGDGSQEGIVVITNTGDNGAILSLTNLKVTYFGEGRSTFTVDESSAAVIRTLAASRAALTDDSTVDEPEQPQEPEQPAEPEWQNPWQNLVNGIKNTVNYIGEKIQSWLGSWF